MLDNLYMILAFLLTNSDKHLTNWDIFTKRALSEIFDWRLESVCNHYQLIQKLNSMRPSAPFILIDLGKQVKLLELAKYFSEQTTWIKLIWWLNYYNQSWDVLVDGHYPMKQKGKWVCSYPNPMIIRNKSLLTDQLLARPGSDKWHLYIYNPKFLADVVCMSKMKNRFYQIRLYPSLSGITPVVLSSKIKNMPSLGCYLIGGLGNQMFLLATSFALCQKYHLVLSYPRKNFGPCSYREVNTYWETSFSDIKMTVPHKGFKTIVKQKGGAFKWHKLKIRRKKKTIGLRGYYQHTKYFHHLRTDLRENLFAIHQVELESLQRHYQWLLKPSSTFHCFLHIRRGDYLKLKKPNHIVPLKYYQNAMIWIKSHRPNKKISWTVFSDDIAWCRTVFPGYFRYIDHEKDYREMYLMRFFHGCIITNSTFSWWGAYLNHMNPLVTIPYHWTKKGIRPTGLVLPGWKIIEY